jgi:hypothetical protein
VPDCGPVSAAVTRSTCLVSATWAASASSVRSASSTESVTSTDADVGPCSAWLSRSAATSTGSAVASATTITSLGPASASMPTAPRRSRFAAVTYTLPGPVTRSTGSTPSTPYANMATAWAPPTAYTSSTPSSAHAARIVRSGRPPSSRRGGVATAMLDTPATWAGITFISTLDGSGASPPGT